MSALADPAQPCDPFAPIFATPFPLSQPMEQGS